jgi:hypothetical protein
MPSALHPIQRYFVIDAPSVPFIAQTLEEGEKNENEAPGKGNGFLASRKGHKARVGTRSGFRLRLSDDHRMAIEDSDLVTRQPKTFFATQEILDASNTALKAAKSKVSLARTGRQMTIRFRRGGDPMVLEEIRPVYSQNEELVMGNLCLVARFEIKDAGNRRDPDLEDFLLAQNCDAIASDVVGGSIVESNFKALNNVKEVFVKKETWKKYGKAKEHTPKKLKLENKIAEKYAKSLDRESKAVERGFNRNAEPGVGKAFMISSLGSGVELPTGETKLLDYASGEERIMRWSYHFGAVVAVSGNDRITLENYARGDMRESRPDPRWYFQMYGEKSGQSFHEFHEGRKEYANPLTIVAEKG